ncbi:MAG: hypothetical protein RMJ88_16680 [Thermogemmata sp.]|nr:hypothetical protein [Thermogemmata sp.]
MKGLLTLLTVCLFSFYSTFGVASWLGLPSFDWQVALFVGGIVAVGTAVVLIAAIATPFIAIQAGASIVGTGIAIAVISSITGIIGGTAAGFYWGRQGDIKRQEQIESIKRVSNQLDIYFHPSADPNRAADFQCTLVFYEETDLESRQPSVTTKKVRILASGADDFYGQVKQEVNKWLTRGVGADKEGQPRRVVIYMDPYPGEGIYERIRELAENNEYRKCTVSKVIGAWKSALP